MTAFKPGQSPPLVKTPIRGLVMGAGEESERLVRIDHAPARSPLVVKPPAPREKLPALAKTVGAAQHHDDQVSRHRGGMLAILANFRFAMRGENQAISRAR